MASSYIISALIVLIGYGWTLNLMEIEKYESPVSCRCVSQSFSKLTKGTRQMSEHETTR